MKMQVKKDVVVSSEVKPEVGGRVLLEMSDGKKYSCVVLEFNYPKMTLMLDDPECTDPDWAGEEVVVTLENIN